MCEPTTILALSSLAISAVGAGMQYDSSRRQGNIAADNIKADAERSAQAIARAQDQQSAAANQQMNDAARKALHDTALFDVVAGEYGGGNSVDRARAVSSIQTGEQLSTISSNGRTAASETAFRGSDIGAQAQQRLASISQPSLFGTALQIGSAALGSYNQYTAGQKAKQPPSRST